MLREDASAGVPPPSTAATHRAHDPREQWHAAQATALLALGAGLGRLRPVAASRMRDVIQRDQPVASQASVTGAVVFYCICSGSMLIVNKLAVVYLPVPALLTVCQFTSASTFVYTCKLLGILEMVQQLGAQRPHQPPVRQPSQPPPPHPPAQGGSLGPKGAPSPLGRRGEGAAALWRPPAARRCPHAPTCALPPARSHLHAPTCALPPARSHLHAPT